LSSSTSGEGDAGTVSVAAVEGVVFSGGRANTDVGETGRGNAGDISVTANVVEVRDGTQLYSRTSGLGNAGTVTVETLDRALFSNSTVSTNVEETGRGNAGDVRVVTNALVINDGAVLSSTNASSVTLNQFTAGDVLVQAEFVRLEEGAEISANTLGKGGNVRLDAFLTVLRGESRIRTNADGNFPGGNITLNTDLLVARENSDITANATDSFGGRVEIETQGIFGSEFRNALTGESDITATSELGAAFGGVVEIISPDVNPTSGLTDLPESPVDVSRLLGTGCSSQDTSSFTVTGRGGLPPSPADFLDRTRVLPDLGPDSEVREREVDGETSRRRDRQSAPLVEATGWVREADGGVILVMGEATTEDFWQPPMRCSGR
ncbi:MAG: hypothetical protein ACP5D4_19635, partial [Baaleninema sp.]